MCPWLVSLVGVLGGGYLHALVVRALVVGRLVVGGYLCTLNLVPWWLVCPWCFVPWWLVCPCVPWSLRLGACALVVRVGCKWLPACLEPCALVVGGYLCTLELVPWSLCLGGSCWL